MKKSYPLNGLLSLIQIFTILFSNGASPLAQNTDRVYSSAEPTTTPVVARVYFHDTNDLNRLASSLDTLEVNHEASYLVALLLPEQYTALQQAGYRLEADQAKTNLINQPHSTLPDQGTDSIPGYPCYRTVEETYITLNNINNAHPDLAELFPIGPSWERLNFGATAGHELLALRLTNENFGVIAEKPTFFLMAEIHAREYVTAETASRFAEYLINNYGIDPDITWLLDYFKVYIVTMTNPDGRKIAEGGISWRKNTDSIAGGGCPSTYGVDLNRNHTFRWNSGGSSPNTCDETYMGPYAGSEPEVQAIEAFVSSIFPDQRGPGDNDPAPDDTTGVFITLHSAAGLVLWPWGWANSRPPNSTQLQTLGRHLAYYNSYIPQQSYQLYQTSGTSDDFAYGNLGIAAYTIEMGDFFFQECGAFESTVYPDNLDALVYAFKSARHPYMDPAGPDSVSISVSPAIITPGDPIQITATTNGNHFAAGQTTQNIAEAHYSIDIPPWISGTITYPMAASDGSFDSKVENIHSTVDSSGLSLGKHILYVESKDLDGNWGVTGAAFLYATTSVFSSIYLPLMSK